MGSLSVKQEEKLQLEQSAIDWLLKCQGYQEWSVISAPSSDSGEGADAVLSSPTGLVNIQISHVFGSQEEAKALLYNPVSLNNQAEYSLSDFLQVLNDRIVQKCHKLIKHRSKEKVSSKNMLLLRSASRLYFLHDLHRVMALIQIPSNHFEQIILMLPQVERKQLYLRESLFYTSQTSSPTEYYWSNETEVLSRIEFPEGTGSWTDLIRLK